ncbi:MAG: hypothetical protein GF364_16650 [Candidatus Lokiarchaeota archaeon]|nr:hypothetical protein [Candidatus Lokiarchaeota archaeon]
MVSLTSVLKKDLVSFVESRGWRLPKGSKKNKPDYIKLIERKLSDAEIDKFFADKTKKARSRRSKKKKRKKSRRKTHQKSRRKIKSKKARKIDNYAKSRHEFVITEKMYSSLLKNINSLSSRIEQLENFIRKNYTRGTSPSSERVRLQNIPISKQRILTAIRNLNMNNKDMRIWVPFDVLYDDLGINKKMISKTEQLILELFYDEKVELEEGGKSTYQVKVRGSSFSRIKLK